MLNWRVGRVRTLIEHVLSISLVIKMIVLYFYVLLLNLKLN